MKTKGRTKTANVETGEDKQQHRTIFWKRESTSDCVLTWYGPRFADQIERDRSLSPVEKEEAMDMALKASRLYSWEKPETRMERGRRIGWGIAGDAWKLEHGDAARRKLQGKWSENTMLMWNSVLHLVMHPDDFYDFEASNSDGRRICETLLNAIKCGNADALSLLGRVIESVHDALGHEGGLKWRVARAVRSSAQRLNRVPTTEEARQEFNNLLNPEEFVEYPEKDFRLALKDAGFGWIVPSRKLRRG